MFKVLVFEFLVDCVAGARAQFSPIAYRILMSFDGISFKSAHIASGLCAFIRIRR